MKKKLIGIVVTSVVVLSLLISSFSCKAPAPASSPTSILAPTSTPTSKPKYDMPKAITWGVTDVGTMTYTQAVAIGDAMGKKEGITLRAVPLASDSSRLIALQTNRIDFMATALAMTLAFEGVDEFAKLEFGPQRGIRLAGMAVGPGGMTLATAGDVKAKTLSDLKGLRVSWIAGLSASNLGTTAQLAFAGLTWNDVKKVTFPSSAAATNGLLAGQVDTFYALTTGATLIQVANAPRGLVLLPLPFSDKEGWKRFQDVLPLAFPYQATEGPGISKEKPHETAVYANPLLVARVDQNPELVYNQTRMLVELFDLYNSVAPGISGWALKQWNLSTTIPWHDGAVKYLKEKGLWTSEVEKHNMELLRRETVLATAFKTAVDQALAKGLKGSDFPDFWLNLRAQSLKAEGLTPYFEEKIQ